jgi:hypothetical protein
MTGTPDWLEKARAALREKCRHSSGQQKPRCKRCLREIDHHNEIGGEVICDSCEWEQLGREFRLPPGVRRKERQ